MKYIVEFEDEPCMYEDEVHFYKCIQAPWWGLSERVIKQLTPYQPDAPDTNVGNITNLCAHENDPISRQMAIDALDVLCQEHRYKIPGKRETYSQYNEAWQDALDRAEGAIFNLPTVQPDHATETTETTETTDGWVSINKRLPAVPVCRCLITRDDGRGGVTVEEALFSFSRWYDNNYLEDGRNRKFDISASVIAWAPFPAPYQGGEKET